MMQTATAITGTEKRQTYIICLFSKRITKTQKRQVRDHLPFLPAGERKKMEAYSKFAQVYDLFMDNIDYEGWADYVTDRLQEY